MNFLRGVTEAINREARKYQAIFLPKHRVDIDYNDTPILINEAYCRIWLAEMHLAKDVEWFKERYPVVHTAVRFNYDGKTVTIPYIATPGKLQELATDNLDKVIQCNYPLTSLFPFKDGLVELQSGLFTVAASDPIGQFIKTMGKFSELLPVPELSNVVKLAEPVYRGIEDLLNIGDRRLELGYQQTFTDANSGGSNFLKAGYFAIILAEEHELNKDKLCIVNDNLREGSPGNTKVFTRDSKPFKGYSYMLFRVETQKHQNWESLTTIKQLVDQAQDAIYYKNFEIAKTFFLPAIKRAIIQSPDVTKADQRNMILKIEQELKELGLQSTKMQKRSLYSIMQRSLLEVDAATEAELAALEQLFQRKDC